MDAEDLKKRTKDFALRVLKLVAALPNNLQADRLVISWLGQELRLVRIIELLVEDDPEPSS
jgi:hypothetical protein